MKKYLVIFLFALLAAVPCARGVEIFLVPGWRTGFSKRILCVEVLRRIYPEAKISVKSWESTGSYKEASARAADFCETFKHELLTMPDERRRELVIIGHSIGAKIVLETMTELAKYNVKVREIIFLGAAFPWDDQRLWSALKTSRTYCYSVVFTDDTLLKYAYPLGEFTRALGCTGWKYQDKNYIERKVEKSSHYAYLYLEAFEKLRRDHPPVSLQVERVLYGCKELRRDQDNIYWENRESFCGWKMQQHKFKDEYRVLDADNMIRATGTREQMAESFADIKLQLDGGKK